MVNDEYGVWGMGQKVKVIVPTSFDSNQPPIVLQGDFHYLTARYILPPPLNGLIDFEFWDGALRTKVYVTDTVFSYQSLVDSFISLEEK